MEENFVQLKSDLSEIKIGLFDLEISVRVHLCTVVHGAR